MRVLLANAMTLPADNEIIVEAILETDVPKDDMHVLLMEPIVYKRNVAPGMLAPRMLIL